MIGWNWKQACMPGTSLGVSSLESWWVKSQTLVLSTRLTACRLQPCSHFHLFHLPNCNISSFPDISTHSRVCPSVPHLANNPKTKELISTDKKAQSLHVPHYLALILEKTRIQQDSARTQKIRQLLIWHNRLREQLKWSSQKQATIALKSWNRLQNLLCL